MNAIQRPDEATIRQIIETAVDAEIPNFSMEGNWYEEYDMDSLGAVALVVEVGKIYKVRLPDDRMPDIRTGNALVTAINELMDAKDQQAAQAAAA